MMTVQKISNRRRRFSWSNTLRQLLFLINDLPLIISYSPRFLIWFALFICPFVFWSDSHYSFVSLFFIWFAFRFVAFVSSNDSFRLQNDQVFCQIARADFKTIKSFCQMLFKRSCLLESNLLLFSHNRNAFFRAQPVHAKIEFSSDREYYKEDVMMLINENDDFFDLHMLLVIIISCLSRWSYCAICSWELFVVKIHAFLKMLCLLLSIVLHHCLSREIDVVVACLSFVEMSEL